MSRLGRTLAGLLAAAFAVDVVSHRAELLVRPWFTWALLGTAVLLAAVAVRVRVRMSPTAAAVLALPIAVGAMITPGLAGRAAQDAGQTTSLATRIGDGSNPLVDGRGGRVTLLQILEAEQQVGGVLLAGRSVEVDAVVAGPHRLKRSVIVCCAADAQTVAIDTRGSALPRTGQWVHVHGQLESDGTSTVLVARSVTSIPTPMDPFL